VTVDSSESVVLRGLSPRELRERAQCEFDRRFGKGCWQLCGERSEPCLVSVGGRVRLYECRFEAVRTDAGLPLVD
jgi:hypothetical protein